MPLFFPMPSVSLFGSPVGLAIGFLAVAHHVLSFWNFSQIGGHHSYSKLVLAKLKLDGNGGLL